MCICNKIRQLKILFFYTNVGAAVRINIKEHILLKKAISDLLHQLQLPGTQRNLHGTLAFVTSLCSQHNKLLGVAFFISKITDGFFLGKRQHLCK